MLPIKKLIASALLAATLSIQSFAGTIDFENMPEDYLFFGGHVNFGNYWAGVTFGPAATVLDAVRYGYNSDGYPAHSGDAVLFSYELSYINAVFDGLVDEVTFWYTANQPFTVSLYDSGDNLLLTQVLGNNYGSNSLVDLTTGSTNIKKVVFSGTGNYFTIDDFGAPNFGDITGEPRGNGVPDTSNSLTLGLLGFLAIAGARKFAFRQ